MKKLDQLEAFIAVANEGSFSLAAKKLDMTPSAVSQKISSLEERLGLDLIKRSSKGVTLTEAGEQVYESAKRIFNEIYEAESCVAQKKQAPEGSLKVLAPICHYTSQYFSEFLKQYPDIHLVLDVSERIPDFANEDLDLVFGFPDDAIQYFSQDTVTKVVGKSRYIYCASPGYLKENGTPSTPQDLLKHRYIAHTQRPNNRVLSFGDNTKIEIPKANTVELSHSLVMQSWAKDGHGVAKLHYYMIEKDLKDGTLVEVLPSTTPNFPIKLSLLYPYTKNLKPSVRYFIDFMIEKFQNDPMFSIAKR